MYECFFFACVMIKVIVYKACIGIDYGNSRLLFRLRVYRYDKDNGGDDYGNKKDNS